jgi:hypothetical protein
MRTIAASASAQDEGRGMAAIAGGAGTIANIEYRTEHCCKHRFIVVRDKQIVGRLHGAA